MSHAVRHAARRLARSAAQTTPGSNPAPGATQQHHLRRPFSHSAPVRESQQRAPTPSVVPPPTGPGDTKQKAKSAISWPGLAFLAGAAAVGQLYYLGGGSTEDLKAGGGSDAPARKASSPKPAKKPEPATKTEPAPAPEATEEDEDVFQAAAELLMQDLDPAEEKKTETAAAESKAERKERKRAERRARKEAPDHATTSESSGASGPAGAARARALANQGGSDLVKDEEEEGAEALTAAALVTRAFEGAVEVRRIANFKLLAFPLVFPTFGFHSPHISSPRHLPNTQHKPTRSQENKEWSATYKAMVYQAEEDAKVFKAELSKAIARKDAESRKQTASLAQEHASAAENAASQIGALANEIERSERRVAALVSELERVGADAEAAIEMQRAEHEAESSRALEEQAELHRMAIAECLVRERTKRAEVIDEVRLKLDGVKEAYDVNGAALRKSHGAVKMSVAVFALAAKASAGEPFSTELAGIRTVGESLGGDDSERALVDAVLASIPEAVAKTGVPTAGDLTNRLDDVRRAARHLQLVPARGGGIVTHLVAYLASWLRVSERGGWGTGNDGSSSSSGGVEAALAVANEKVAAGRLDAAAAALEAGTEGTAAARAVAGWVADARERQRLEMAVSVLRSHAAAVASSLA